MKTRIPLLLLLSLSLFAVSASLAQCPSPLPSLGAALSRPLPVFPMDNG